MNYVCRMDLQSAYKDYLAAMAKIYERDEAENIWKIVSEKIIAVRIHRNHYSRIILNNSQVQQLKSAQERLLRHEPIQYVINECWFYDIPFYVDNNVLIPRPETEEIVDWVIKENKLKENLAILDVGTGSGCIPITLKRKIPAATVNSCDISNGALAVARKNAAVHETVIHFFHIDFLNEKNRDLLPEVDVIISNPPYIPECDKNEIRKNVLDHEPHLALFVKNEDPLIFYQAIAKFGLQRLKQKGSIYVEIHESFAEMVIQTFEQMSYSTELRKDIQGKERMVKAFRSA